MESTLTPVQYESCEQCGSPVDDKQRYCVVCGSRRKHVHDPALRYLAASAGARARGATKPTGQSGRGRRSAGLGTALVIAVIPLAVALGLLIGHAGSGSDAKVLAALRAAKAPVVNVQAGAGSGTLASTGTSSSQSSKHKKSGKSSGNSGKVLNTTKYGSFHSVTSTNPPSQSQLQQGSQVASHDESDTNQSYVNQQKNLPNSISVP
jgi:hypothetical protein